jgi:hypothetical protein
VLFLVGSTTTACSALGGLNWPKALQCAAPLSQDLIDAVGGILLQDGDPSTVLEQLASELGKDGPDAVACAVAAAISGEKVGASPKSMAARSRGEKFLADHGVAK